MSKLAHGIALFVVCVAHGSASRAAPTIIFPHVHVQAPVCVTLVGSLAGVPSPLGTFQVRVTDIANNPLNGASVVVDLSDCTDLRLCSGQLDPAAVVNCTKKTVTKVTNALGIVSFTLLGGSIGPLSAGQGSGPLQGKIYVSGYANEGVSMSACTYDLDGLLGVGANDLGMWLTDFGSGLPLARSDYDGDGRVGANDLSAWLTTFGDGSMASSCTGVCP